MQNINQINDLKAQLNIEKENYKKLEQKYNQLEQRYNQLYTNNQSNIININQLQSELNRYKNLLSNANLSIQNNIKDNEINNLKLKLQNNYVNKPNVPMKDIMVVNFVTGDGKISNCGIKCLPDETFAEVEEKLYKMYDEYRNTNSNYFICGGRIILRFKKLRENNIKDGDVIQLCQNELNDSILKK